MPSVKTGAAFTPRIFRKILQPAAPEFDFEQPGAFHPQCDPGQYRLAPYHKDGTALKRFDYIVSNPPFKLDFSGFRDELDSKENKQRFFAGIPKVPKAAKDKMAIYQLFLQHIIHSLNPAVKLPWWCPPVLSPHNRVSIRASDNILSNTRCWPVWCPCPPIFSPPPVPTSPFFYGCQQQGRCGADGCL